MNLWELADLSTPWSIHVAATLRIADHIAAGKTEIAELAAASGADRDSLHRVLRHLVSKGIFEEPAHGRFALNEAAQAFFIPPVRMALDLDNFGGRMAHAWGTMLDAVRTGKPAYHKAFGRGFWEDLNANPKIAAEFDDLMGPGHGTPDPNILIDPADWARVKTVVDVGGGTGALLAEVLRAHPKIRGTLVDLPRTVARAPEVFKAAGVADRATAVGQSFFDPLPAGHDLYVMKSVLSDWPDREATAILKRCADAARPNGRVVTSTGVGPGEQANPELLMMVLVGGKDRTVDEWRALAKEAGLVITGAGKNPAGRNVVEFGCEKAGG